MQTTNISDRKIAHKVRFHEDPEEWFWMDRDRPWMELANTSARQANLDSERI